MTLELKTHTLTRLDDLLAQTADVTEAWVLSPDTLPREVKVFRLIHEGSTEESNYDVVVVHDCMDDFTAAWSSDPLFPHMEMSTTRNGAVVLALHRDLRLEIEKHTGLDMSEAATNPRENPNV